MLSIDYLFPCSMFGVGRSMFAQFMLIRAAADERLQDKFTIKFKILEEIAKVRRWRARVLPEHAPESIDESAPRRVGKTDV